jgi:hypothetical protein
MTIEIGETMTWHRVSNDWRRTDEIPVRILKIARNGVFVEIMLPDGVTPPDGVKRKARVARQYLLPVRPPSAPYVRPTTPPPDLKPMLGEAAGRIPEFLPKPWDPVIAMGDETKLVHAVPSGTKALCGYESATGWQWGGRELDVTCEQCCRKIMEDEFERDGIVQYLRKRGHTGPIDRETYISFNWAGCKIRPWTAEHEDAPPALLQDWDRFYKNAERREKRRKDQLKRDPEFKGLQAALGLPEE